MKHDILYPFAIKAFRRCTCMMRDASHARSLRECIAIIDQCNASRSSSSIIIASGSSDHRFNDFNNGW